MVAPEAVISSETRLLGSTNILLDPMASPQSMGLPYVSRDEAQHIETRVFRVHNLAAWYAMSWLAESAAGPWKYAWNVNILSPK
jgi:hypothetical protein